jgi:hypothetical protein
MTDDAEKSSPEAERRKPGGRPFQPGQSGNPAGKPKGTRNRSTLIFEGLLDKAGPKLIRRAIKLAMDGDAGVMRALLPLLLPPRRDRGVQFPLPPIESAEDALRASQMILDGCASGVLSPVEAAELSKVLADHCRLYELTTLEAKLAAIEADRGIGLGERLPMQ